MKWRGELSEREVANIRATAALLGAEDPVEPR
jgi:hypothetical protein